MVALREREGTRIVNYNFAFRLLFRSSRIVLRRFYAICVLSPFYDVLNVIILLYAAGVIHVQ